MWHTCKVLSALCALACGFSTNINMLVGLRFLNGFFAAPLTLGPTIVNENFIPEKRGNCLKIAYIFPMVG